MAQFNAAAERDPLIVSLDPQFANRWLPSRLPKLLSDPAGANLEMRVEERRADFITYGVDVAVRYGTGRWEGLEAQRLFAETLIPVCSPNFAAGHAMRQPRDLLTAPLLHHSYRPWSLWFSAFGLEAPARQGLLFKDSVMLVEAAAQGLGVALARSGLIEADLATGRLVRPLETAVASDLGFFIVWPADNRKRRRIHALRDWLVAEAALARPMAS